MPMPWTYRQASREWQAFLGDAKEAMDLASDNAAFTAVEGVLMAFRCRLTPQQVIDFAQVLPAVLRALFVADWLLAETFVAATPGLDFDPLNGRRYMRFSYAGRHGDMVEALDRLERFLL